MSKDLINISSYNNENNTNFSEISNILDNLLFLGSQGSTHHDIIKKYNIKNIVSLGCNPLVNNIKIIKYDVSDNSDPNNLYIFFNLIIPAIHSIINDCILKNEPILIHCLAGISRSVSVIITWLMFYKNMTYEEAYLYIKMIRPIISPNASFINYMKSLKV